jgi:hypothetical protein
MHFTKTRAFAAIAASAALLSTGCDQAAIFNAIANETKKAKAVIEGSPTRIVKIGTDLFVANGDLWKRDATDGTGAWTKAARPTSGDTSLKVRDIETTDGSTLYALTVYDVDTLSKNETTTRVWKSTDKGASWSEITLASAVSSYSVDSLYAANGILFAGAHAADATKSRLTAYAVLKLTGTTLDAAASNLVGFDDGGMFVGAAYDNSVYYLATTNLGIFQYDGSTATAVSSTTGYFLKGIAAVGGGATKAVIAVGRGEDTLIKLPADTGFTADGQSYIFTGAIAEFDADGDSVPDYLLLGTQTGTTYGYREIALSGGTLTTAKPSLSKPSESSSVNDYDQYAGALGVVPVSRLYQSKEGSTSILYASTDIEGLWASVNKDDWNLVAR